MRQHPSPHNIVFTVLFSILMALSLNACSDTNNVSGPESLSSDAQLSSLTVTPGTLQPVFSGDVANYTVDVTSNVAKRHGHGTTAGLWGHGQHQWPDDNQSVGIPRSTGVQYPAHNRRDGSERESEHLPCDRESGGTCGQ